MCPQILKEPQNRFGAPLRLRIDAWAHWIARTVADPAFAAEDFSQDLIAGLLAQGKIAKDGDLGFLDSNRVLKNLACKIIRYHFRKKRRRPQSILPVATNSDPSFFNPQAKSQICEKRMRGLVRAGYASLSICHQRIIAAWRLRGSTVRSVAAQCRCSTGTVCQVVQKFEKSIRNLIHDSAFLNNDI